MKNENFRHFFKLGAVTKPRALNVGGAGLMVSAVESRSSGMNCLLEVTIQRKAREY